jgi:hypothetical protein
MLGVCLVAVFAIGAVASASAMAEGRPEYKHCGKAAKVGKTYTGEFSDKGCTTPVANGKYQLEEVAENTEFTSKTKAVTINANGKAIKCKKGVDKGAILSQFESNVTLTLSGCAVNGNKHEPCGTAGTITTDPLSTGLYFVNEAETEPGVALFGAEGVFAEFTCGATNVVIEGTLLGNVKTTSKGMALTFATSAGKQALQQAWFFETPIEVHLTSGESEVTVEGVDEQGPKGVGVFL